MSRIPVLDESSVLVKGSADGLASTSNLDVTVVTVVFNAVQNGRGGLFRTCLKSVQEQCGCRVEHVIVDGASTDGTLELIRDYPNGQVALRCLSLPDRGIYEAMNRGIALAHGRYVVFLNSDDFFNNPNGLADSVRSLDASGADFSYAPAVVIDENGTAVPHAFTDGWPFQLAEGMTLCHQTMLTRRDVLVRMDGFDTRYRSAADYDLLLRMLFQGCHACRVENPFVTFRLGGYSAAHADVCNREMADIYERRFNADLGAHLTQAGSLRIRRNGIMPETLACRMAPFGRQTYGALYRLPEARRDGWRNLLAGQLHERAVAWCRRLRCPNVWQRRALALRCRLSRKVDEVEKANDLDFMYRYVQRVQPTESGLDVEAFVESKYGLATAKPLDVTFKLNDWLRRRPVWVGMLLRVDATGVEGVWGARVTCRGRELGRVRSGRGLDMPLIEFYLPEACNTSDEMNLRVELVGEAGTAPLDAVQAVLVYGGLAIGFVK